MIHQRMRKSPLTCHGNFEWLYMFRICSQWHLWLSNDQYCDAWNGIQKPKRNSNIVFQITTHELGLSFVALKVPNAAAWRDHPNRDQMALSKTIVVSVLICFCVMWLPLAVPWRGFCVPCARECRFLCSWDLWRRSAGLPSNKHSYHFVVLWTDCLWVAICRKYFPLLWFQQQYKITSSVLETALLIINSPGSCNSLQLDSLHQDSPFPEWHQTPLSE